MAVNSADIEAIVKQVLQGMAGQTPSAASVASSVAASVSTPAGAVPKTARVAMLTQLEKMELKELCMMINYFKVKMAKHTTMN